MNDEYRFIPMTESRQDDLDKVTVDRAEPIFAGLPAVSQPWLVNVRLETWRGPSANVFR